MAGNIAARDTSQKADGELVPWILHLTQVGVNSRGQG
jgi:hypothetical protein